MIFRRWVIAERDGTRHGASYVTDAAALKAARKLQDDGWSRVVIAYTVMDWRADH